MADPDSRTLVTEVQGMNPRDHRRDDLLIGAVHALELLAVIEAINDLTAKLEEVRQKMKGRPD